MINVEPSDLKLVKKLLMEHVGTCKVIAFGSRVTGNHHEYSDLDLAVIGEKPLTLEQLGLLRDAFSASNLPFTVDILDWHQISPSFQSVIKKSYIVVQESGAAN